MTEEILRQLPSLGVSGLLFVMWWGERAERHRGAAAVQDAQQSASRLAHLNGELLDVIRSNTEVLTALREELRAHRATEVDWLARISRQMESD